MLMRVRFLDKHNQQIRNGFKRILTERESTSNTTEIITFEEYQIKDM